MSGRISFRPDRPYRGSANHELDPRRHRRPCRCGRPYQLIEIPPHGGQLDTPESSKAFHSWSSKSGPCRISSRIIFRNNRERVV